MRVPLAGLAAALISIPCLAAGDDAARAAYSMHCAACHGADRLGGIGPALLPENLRRLKPERAAATIRNGAPASQMPSFAGRLEDSEIDGLVKLIYSPLPHRPVWDREQIEKSRIIHATPLPDGTAPRHNSDPLNLFVVVETGDHHVTILDGDTFSPIYRFKSRYALHGGPKFSPEGRFVYFASRDGWVSLFDLNALTLIAEIRAGINTRNLAVSSDGRYVMVANYLPHTLVLLNAADLSLVKVIAVEDEHGTSSRVSAVYDAAPRKSFIVALKDLKELWEIQYGDQPVYYGKVHDYRDEGPPKVTERFPIRRIRLDDYLDDFFFDPSYQHIIGAARDGGKGQVINLAVGRKIAEIDLPGLPHLGSGISWNYRGTPVVATPNLREAVVSIIDMRTWRTLKRIKTLGPGFFMRSHENSRYAWVDVFFGPNRDAVHVIDKQTLEIVKTLRPAPGKTAAHVEFTRNGRYALLSIWDMDGALVVYDADTLEEVRRVPMKKPSGKYNVYNKIAHSRGTSH